MRRIILAGLLALCGCAAFDDPLEPIKDSLNTGEIDTAIAAAKPGQPRISAPADQK